MSVNRLLMAATAICFSATPTIAQVLLMPELQKSNQLLECGSHSNPSNPLIELRDHYLAGRWEHLQSRTRELLKACTFQREAGDPHLFVEGKDGKGAPTYLPHYERDWYAVVVATVDTNDEPMILRYLVHDPVPYPYSTTTVGVPAEARDAKGSKIFAQATSRLIQVFLSPNRALTLQTRIQVTETADPLQEQIADVIKAAIDPAAVVPLLKGLIPPSTRADAPAPSAGPLFASVSRVFPPFSRGDYKYADVIRAPATLDFEKALSLRDRFDVQVDNASKAAEASEKAMGEAIKTEEATLKNAKATRAERARATSRRVAAVTTAREKSQEYELAQALATAAKTYLADQQQKECGPVGYKDTCWTGLKAKLTAAKDGFCIGNDLCKGERADLVLLRFQELGQPPKPTTASTSTTVTAVPYQRLSFGAVSAYIAGASAKEDRVKVDGGKVVSDPISRAMTAVVLNVHPRFNPKAPRMERGERLRGFAGAVLTPNLGLNLGVGYGFLRNLSVNVGYALLAIPTRREGDLLDQPPSDGTKPFRVGAAHLGFVGFGYKFGK